MPLLLNLPPALGRVGLIQVTRSHVVERYNRALERISGKTTQLMSFSIDAMGFSPEIAAEFGNLDYMDPHGANPHFILVDAAQVQCPTALRLHFTWALAVMRQFVAANLAQVNALLMRDVVFGEIDNGMPTIRSHQDLDRLRRVRVRVATSRDLIDKSRDLSGMIDRLKAEPMAWADDVFLGQMIDAALITGDILERPVEPETISFVLSCYHTLHFGGVHVFDIPEAEAQAQRRRRIGEPVASEPERDSAGLTSRRIFCFEAGVPEGLRAGDPWFSSADVATVIGLMSDAGRAALINAQDHGLDPYGQIGRIETLAFIDAVLEARPEDADLAALDIHGWRRLFREHAHRLGEHGVAIHEVARMARANEEVSIRTDAFACLLPYFTRGTDLTNPTYDHMMARYGHLDFPFMHRVNQRAFAKIWHEASPARRAVMESYLTKGAMNTVVKRLIEEAMPS